MNLKSPTAFAIGLLIAGSIQGAPVSAAVPNGLTGTIKIDGSSTVYPITEAVAEEFGKASPGTQVTVGISGTGGGFKKFCVGETDISDASRPIKAAEIETCKTNNVEYVELPVAYDALTVVINPKNTWATSMTVAELKKIWEPEAQGKIMTWNQIRPTWPNKPIRLFGAGVDSGTYDYFTEAIVGKEHSSRGDFTSSEDDNVLVQGVASDEGALGFFGLAYYEENQGKLKAVLIDDGKDTNGKGPQAPTLENVIQGNYQPLARPLFVYVSKKAAERAEVAEFMKFYLGNSTTLAKEVGYVPLPSAVATLAQSRFNGRVFGSIFAHGGSQVGVSLEELLKMEKTS
ncbi:MAG: PstS family phosphate ABC transporter substrate-binding protein [Deltaproteobacteria bacterium]|nr:PstS family phosphate ABC transporter substrate-binding protein [Deltaproteobacteria bacterium]